MVRIRTKINKNREKVSRIFAYIFARSFSFSPFLALSISGRSYSRSLTQSVRSPLFFSDSFPSNIWLSFVRSHLFSFSRSHLVFYFSLARGGSLSFISGGCRVRHATRKTRHRNSLPRCRMPFEACPVGHATCKTGFLASLERSICSFSTVSRTRKFEKSHFLRCGEPVSWKSQFLSTRGLP